MTERQITLAELKGRQWEEVLRDVADQQERVAVLLPDGREVVIEPRTPLKPLPELEGHVPAGWKDALYARG
ncbi:MAG: hypothetical protein HYW07_14015 [Candidatus Latescibacteria bacterium]|nr:hypothetical protein [Candidatus Latescibacterota bacterium]